MTGLISVVATGNTGYTRSKKTISPCWMVK